MKLFFALTFCLLQISWCRVDKTWWKYTTMYQVFLPSFKDGSGDGIGDLKGLISKLDHFVDMGVETVYITPHYESPMVDNGYDITNYMSVNPLLGTMEDFDVLIKEMNSRRLKLVIDVVINHSSDKHPWFIKSINREDQYTDFYVWKNPKGYDTNGMPIPPNNWISRFQGNSSWTWNNKRKQFYYHAFTPQQPDLNLRNEATKIEIKKMLKFWLEKGVAGLRFDATGYFFEDAQFRDEPLTSANIKIPRVHSDLNHIYTYNIRDTYDYLYEIRRFVDKVTKKYKDFERILISENYINGEKLIQYYGTKKSKIMHIPLNFVLANEEVRYQNASFYHSIIIDYLRNLPKWATPTWNAENHDRSRKALLLNEEFEFIFASMVMMLPGMAYIYYGQEIGVTGSRIREDQVVNKYKSPSMHTLRDYFRHPMPWDDSLNGGFSTNYNLYLPLNPNYWRINLKTQKEQKHSYYHMFREMANLRKTKTFKYGDFKSYVISNWVYAFSRTYKKKISLVIINFGSGTEFIDLHSAIDDLPGFSAVVQVASPNSGYNIGDQVPTKQEIPKILILRPLAVLVLGTGHENIHI